MENLEKKERVKNINEDCYRLAIGDMGKKLLKNEHKGTLKLSNGSSSLFMVYKIEHKNKPRAIIDFTNNLKPSAILTNQIIEIEEDVAPFGLRPFFICPECGTMRRVLYLPPDKNNFAFKCRKCQNIVYHSTRMNRRTCDGLFYYTEHLLKLINKRERIARLFYRGKATNKYRAFIIDYLALTRSVSKPTRERAETLMTRRANNNLSMEQEYSQFL